MDWMKEPIRLFNGKNNFYGRNQAISFATFASLQNFGMHKRSYVNNVFKRKLKSALHIQDDILTERFLFSYEHVSTSVWSHNQCLSSNINLNFPLKEINF